MASPSYPSNDKKKANQVQRGQWIRAAILGANDGLLSTTSLMLGVGAARNDHMFMVLSGVAGAIAGSCSMALGEFVSVSTQRDIENLSYDHSSNLSKTDKENNTIYEDNLKDMLPNPYKAAGASGLAFIFGSIIPLVPATFIVQNMARNVVVVVVASIALALFGGSGAYFGGSRVRISAIRVLFGGWITMGLTYGLLKSLNKFQNHRDSQ
ncbi:vacuolar iron transporter homolog 2.1-like isoform X2 [Impatiens glandulifera]|nr:vacuolar iron transporter homolog 2.1-like isoform X2 [Impatiens glandulifera]